MTANPRGPGALRGGLEALLHPIAAERRRLNARRRRALADKLRGPQQVLGAAHHSCGATHGLMERCDFACTSCYLDKGANATRPLPAEEVHRQLDTLRGFLGPQGKAQITSGEVTLLPRSVLGGYVRYAKKIGLDPMVMTHGQRFLDQPGYLEELVRIDGLEKISIHIDITQRGRKGWRPDQNESDLQVLRSCFADLIRDVRQRTGRTLHAAHTVTVTARNLYAVPDIVKWVASNTDAFRMVSFQPAAEVGRTQDKRIADLSLDDVWQRICAGLGQPLHRHAMHFGHPECHVMAPLVVARSGDQQVVLETAREGKRWDRAYLGRLMRGIGGYSTRGRSRLQNVLGVLGLCLRNPWLLVETPFYGLYRLWGIRGWLSRALAQTLRGRLPWIRPLVVVVHKFMSPDELDTDLGRERLAACVFQVPVDGNMVPMCEVNATPLRAQLTSRIQGQAARSQRG